MRSLDALRTLTLTGRWFECALDGRGPSQHISQPGKCGFLLSRTAGRTRQYPSSDSCGQRSFKTSRAKACGVSVYFEALASMGKDRSERWLGIPLKWVSLILLVIQTVGAPFHHVAAFPFAGLLYWNYHSLSSSTTQSIRLAHAHASRTQHVVGRATQSCIWKGQRHHDHVKVIRCARSIVDSARRLSNAQDRLSAKSARCC
eukprot:5442636-Amphidinium_carterae.1